MTRRILMVIAALSLVSAGFVGVAQAQDETPICIDYRQQVPIDEFASNPDLMELIEFKKDNLQYSMDSLADELAERGQEHGEEVSDCATGSNS